MPRWRRPKQHRAGAVSSAAVIVRGPATGGADAAPPPSSEHGRRRRRSTGDTGLWFVPIGEVLPAKRWSFSVYSVNFDYDQGFTDVSNWPVTFGFGLANRAEIFGAWTLVRRIDRDVRPIFVPQPASAASSTTTRSFGRGGPTISSGICWLGGKVNLLSQFTPGTRGVCRTWHDQDPHREGRRRGRRQRQG